jgi:hypothetical protein
VLLSVGADSNGIRAASGTGWRAVALEPEDAVESLWGHWATVSERGGSRVG